MLDKYTIDKCSICGKHKALKNGVCKECEELEKDLTSDLPDFMKDLFNGTKEK